MNESQLRSRIQSLLASATDSSIPAGGLVETNQLYCGVLTVVSSVYGCESEHFATLRAAREFCMGGDDLSHPRNGLENYSRFKQIMTGVLSNLKEEVDSGLVGSLRERPTSELITDFIRLAKVTLSEAGRDAINVAAVLVAVAYEDALRRMGETFAGIIEKDDLGDVIHALRTRGILVSSQLGTALSYLSFRKHALDANWDAIDRSTVSGCMGFVEELLFTHFQ